MRLIFLFCLAAQYCWSTIAWSYHATVELSIAQVDWNAKSKNLYFDIEVKAVDKPFYLAFSDIVLAFPKTAVDTNFLDFSLIPGTTQLFNLAGERLNFPGIRTRIKSKGDSLLFIIQLMPNNFNATTDFFEQSAQITHQPGQSRIGRFAIKGIFKAPEIIKPFYAPKGPSTLLMAFDPKDQFKAVDLSVNNIGVKAPFNVLKSFECSVNAKEFVLVWSWSDTKQFWQLWYSNDNQNWNLLQSGKGGQGLKLDKALPVFAGISESIAFRLSYSVNGIGEKSLIRLPIQ